MLGEVLGDLYALFRQETDGPQRWSWRVRRLYCRVIDEDVLVHGSKVYECATPLPQGSTQAILGQCLNAGTHRGHPTRPQSPVARPSPRYQCSRRDDRSLLPSRDLAQGPQKLIWRRPQHGV